MNNGLNRRRLLTGAMAAGAAVVAGTSGIMLVNAASGASATAMSGRFDETYQGRRIHGGVAHTPIGEEHDLVYIDNDVLHVMRNADGTVTTSVNHYQTFDSLKAAAKAAVETLGDLRPVGAGIAHH